MIHQNTRKRVLEKLLESLGSAERGSRELDIIISFVLGDTSSDADKMIQLLVEEGYPWQVVSELLDQDLPPYTSSLDAALPGENIVLTLHSPRRARWAAVHGSATGEQVLVWAASECLARRRAALTALRGTLPRQASAAARQAAARPVPRRASGGQTPHRAESVHGWSRPPETEAARTDTPEEGEAEWKILF
jgi:hypothetical protein